MAPREGLVQTLCWVALPFALISVIIPIIGIYRHFTHYHKPTLQRYIVRIQLMIPVYATVAWLSLQFVGAAKYLSLLRDCYQAFVIATFFLLVVEYLGGEMAVIEKLAQKEPIKRRNICCIERKPLILKDHPEKHYVRAKRLTLQFVVVMPLIGLITFILDVSHYLRDDDYGADSIYLWLNVAHVITIIFSMFNMHAILGWLEPEIDATPGMRADAKFWCIKLVVFLSFLQGMLIGLIYYFAGANHEVSASDLQGILVCMELSLITVVHLSYFSYREFYVEGGAKLTKSAAFVNAFMTADFFKDTYKAFNTTPSAEAFNFHQGGNVYATMGVSPEMTPLRGPYQGASTASINSP